MAKFKKALALVLSLAMVLTLAPIANVQTKAASKYKIKAATTATGTYAVGQVISGALTLAGATGTDVVITATVSKAGGTTVTKCFAQIASAPH